MECEQPGIGEESIWPQPAEPETEAEVRPLHPLLQQQGSQPTPDRSVDGLEDMRMGMLEVAEPAAQHRIETGDHAGEAGKVVQLLRKDDAA